MQTIKTTNSESTSNMQMSQAFKEGFLSEALQRELEQIQDDTPNKNDDESKPIAPKSPDSRRTKPIIPSKFKKNDKKDDYDDEALNKSQEKVEERIKKTLMWNVGRPEQEKELTPL